MVQSIQNDVENVSATGKTKNSVHFMVNRTNTGFELLVVGRKFFSALETGRGPRTSSDYGGFEVNLEEWMDARGIGADLSPKKKKNLARYLALKINREGDSVYKKGGREVYSDNLDLLIQKLMNDIKSQFKNYVIKEIKDGFN